MDALTAGVRTLPDLVRFVQQHARSAGRLLVPEAVVLGPLLNEVGPRVRVHSGRVGDARVAVKQFVGLRDAPAGGERADAGSDDACAQLESIARELFAFLWLPFPFVAQFYGAALVGYDRATDTADQLWLIIELVGGAPLSATRLPADPFQRTAWTVEIVARLADAMRDIHSRGFVHQGLTCDNVKLTETGEIKLIDFGRTPAAGGAGGGRAFVAPEQMARAQGHPVPITGAADVYSMAVIAVTLLAGLDPAAVSTGTREWWADQLRAARVPSTLSGLLLRCLSHRPEERPAAGELAHLLRTVHLTADLYAPPMPVVPPVLPVAPSAGGLSGAGSASTSAVASAALASAAGAGAGRMSGSTVMTSVALLSPGLKPGVAPPAGAMPTLSITSGASPMSGVGPAGAVSATSAPASATAAAAAVLYERAMRLLVGPAAGSAQRTRAATDLLQQAAAAQHARALAFIGHVHRFALGSVPMDPGQGAVLLAAALALGDPVAVLVRAAFRDTPAALDDALTAYASLHGPEAPAEWDVFALYVLACCQSDTDAAFQQLEELAQQGFALAQYDLGHDCCTGLSSQGRVHYAQALQWFRRAAEQGHSAAQNNLACLYAGGFGTEPNLAESVRWCQRAAEQGNPLCQYNLGAAIETGLCGDVADATAALPWYQLAADRGVPRAQVRLGLLCLHGLPGWPRSAYRAVAWFRLAAEQGSADGLLQLALCYRKGVGVPKDKQEALRLLERAAELGSAEAMYELACWHEHGTGGGARDLKRALQLHRQAAEAGQPDAQYRLGVHYETRRKRPGQRPDDEREALQWFARAAEQGHAQAAEALLQRHAFDA